MRRPLAYSLLLHLTVVLIAVLAAFLPSPKPLLVEEPLDVELVSIGEKTAPPPAVAREPRPEPATPTPPLPRPEVESKSEPAPKSETVARVPPPAKAEPEPRPAPALKSETSSKPAPPEPAPKPEPKPEAVARVETPSKPEAPPKPPAKPAPPVAERKPESPKPEPPKPEAPKQMVAKPEPAAKPEPKVAEAKPQTEKPAPAKPQPKSDFDSVVKSIQELKQKTPPKAGEQPQAKPKMADGEPSLEQRLAQALRSPSPTASALAQPLTMSEIDAIRRQIERCWNLPAGAKDAENLVVAVRVEMNSDGTPREAAVENQAEMRANPFFRSAAESALRAVLNPRCHPFKLPPEKYDRWKSMTLVFNPKEMAGT